jgi:acyl carrier protein
MLEARIKKVMASVFGVDENLIDENTSPKTLEAWDSLKQITLILSLEDEFNIQFSDDETVELVNFQAVKKVLSLKS